MNEDNKDALNNLINSIQEKMNDSSNSENEQSDSSNNETSTFDISAILNILGSNTNNNSNTSNKNSNNTSQDTGFDPSMLFKIQNIVKALNNNSPQKDLLLSLKPFLRKSRQDKMNEYITILNVISMLESFKDKGSD